MKVTDYLAVYAALLSTLVFVWNVVQSRPKVRVDLIFGLDEKGDDLRSGVWIVIRNLSSHDVHLAGIDLLYKGTTPSTWQRLKHMWRFKSLARRMSWVHSSLSLYGLESGCPLKLEARKSHQVFVPEKVTEKIFAKAVNRDLIACVQDQLWNNVYSSRFAFPKSARDSDA